MVAGFIKLTKGTKILSFAARAMLAKGKNGMNGANSTVREVRAAAILARPAAQPIPYDLIAQSLHRLDTWLGFSQTTRRKWGERLPAVFAASLALTAYAWSSGLQPVDPRLAIWLGLAASVLGRYSDLE